MNNLYDYDWKVLYGFITYLRHNSNNVKKYVYHVTTMINVSWNQFNYINFQFRCNISGGLILYYQLSAIHSIHAFLYEHLTELWDWYSHSNVQNIEGTLFRRLAMKPKRCKRWFTRKRWPLYMYIVYYCKNSYFYCLIHK